MENTLSQSLFASILNEVMQETFEQVQGIYLDKGTSLFETLADINAEEASQPISGGCATLAAQVKHVTFYLRTLEHYMFDGSNERVDWGEIWRTTKAVTAEEWAFLQTDLQTAYGNLRSRMEANTDWNNERPLGGALAVITHTAYHLGEIRQATCVLKHK
jgi:hypothetical protein